jgi:excisionase family DNA binding protein
MASGEPRLLRPAEVAAVFGVNAKTVARWAKEGKLRSVRTPGGHMRLYEEDVRALVAEQQLESART